MMKLLVNDDNASLVREGIVMHARVDGYDGGIRY